MYFVINENTIPNHIHSDGSDAKHSRLTISDAESRSDRFLLFTRNTVVSSSGGQAVKTRNNNSSGSF